MNQKRILVVEDDSAIRQGIVDALQFAGYETLQAANGNDGMAQALRASFDLLLLDLILPGQNGFDILKAAREGKEQTSWTDPDGTYEKALSDFVAGLLDAEISAGFLASFGNFAARTALARSADFLHNYPQLKIVIEGHCDERGSTEYNLALGDRRAAAVKQYLVGLGIGADRISTVSYGKEKPACMESTEDCWQRNRRGHFVMAK